MWGHVGVMCATQMIDLTRWTNTQIACCFTSGGHDSMGDRKNEVLNSPE